MDVPSSPLISTTQRECHGSKSGRFGKRPDLGNRALVAPIIGAATVLVLYFAFLQPALPKAWRTPGSPELYLVGVAGAALLLVSMVFFVLVKRTGRGGPAPAWFIAHVVASTVGAVLVHVTPRCAEELLTHHYIGVSFAS